MPILLAVAALAAVESARAVTNPQVAGLQIALRSHGLYPGTIDGIAGPITARGVSAFQQRVGLKATGIATARTRDALGRLGRPLYGTRALRRGMVGWDVSVLEFLLARRGFPPKTIDGRFGRQTRSAVRRYQRAAGLRIDGIAGPRTLTALVEGRRLRPREHRKDRPARRPRDQGERGDRPSHERGRVPGTPRATYRVMPGDTLTAIAARYGTTVQRLVKLNHLDLASVIVIGTRLEVPRRPLGHAGVRRLVDRWATRYGVSRKLARALAWQESGYQTNLTSKAGAWGVMQVMPATWDFVEVVLFGKPVRRSVAGNVRVGVAYLHHLLQRFQGDERLAIGAYHQGARAVRRRGLFEETERFVANVLALKSRV